MTLDPKDLSAEERAIVDQLALREFSRAETVRTARACYQGCLAFIEARRKFFAPTQPEPKREECPNCKKPVSDRWEHNKHTSAFRGSKWVCPEPAPPPAPAASELPEAVADAIDAITDAYNETDDGYGCAAALEAWARSQTQPVDASAVYDEGFADGVALQKRCEAQPSAVGMTPELEMVLKAASLRCGYLLRGAQTKTKLTESRRLSTAIAAVRAQAASAQAVPVQVEAIPIGLWQLEELLKYADLAEVALRTGFHPPDFLFDPADCSLRNRIDAVKEQRDRYLAAVERGK